MVRKNYLQLINVIMVAFFCIGLTACDKEESENDSPETPVNPQAKHITRIIDQKSDGELVEYNFTYDSQVRVIMIVEKRTNEKNHYKDHIYLFFYDNDTITIKKDLTTYKYSLLDGRITSQTISHSYTPDTYSVYSYNNNGQMIKMNSSVLTWTNGDLTESESSSANQELYYRTIVDYSKHLAPANFYPIYFFISYENALAMMGFFGKMPLHLVNSISHYDANGYYMTISYTYQMQDDLPVMINYTEVYDDRYSSQSSSTGQITIEWDDV